MASPVEVLRRELNPILAEYYHHSKVVEEEEKVLAEARLGVEDTLNAQRVVQNVAESVQQTVHRQVATVVTRCLQTVFPDPYTFKINFHQKRGKTEAELVFVREGREVDPTTAAGGGVVDVASFGLRLACLMLSQPKRRRLLVLDEPFKFVSREYIPRLRELLLSLCGELGLQVVMVTHRRGLMIGKVISLE